MCVKTVLTSDKLLVNNAEQEFWKQLGEHLRGMIVITLELGRHGYFSFLWKVTRCEVKAECVPNVSRRLFIWVLLLEGKGTVLPNMTRQSVSMH